MFNFQASIQASSQQRALHPGPGCRTFITTLGIVMSWSVAQVSVVERPFPTLSIPCGCEAYPRDLLVDCVWFTRAFTLVSEKRWHHNCHRLWWHCGCRFPFSRTLFPSSCDVFSWLLSSFVTSHVCAFLLSRFVHNITFWGNYSVLVNSCVSQLASLFSSQHGIREPHVVIRAVV